MYDAIFSAKDTDYLNLDQWVSVHKYFGTYLVFDMK